MSAVSIDLRTKNLPITSDFKSWNWDFFRLKKFFAWRLNWQKKIISELFMSEVSEKSENLFWLTSFMTRQVWASLHTAWVYTAWARRRLLKQNLNQKTPSFKNWRWIFFRIEKFFRKTTYSGFFWILELIKSEVSIHLWTKKKSPQNLPFWKLKLALFLIQSFQLTAELAIFSISELIMIELWEKLKNLFWLASSSRQVNLIGNYFSKKATNTGQIHHHTS